MEIKKDIIWNKDTYQNLVEYLVSLSEESYKEFNSKIVSTKYEMLGIRIPFLRKIAKQISKTNFLPLLDLFDKSYFEVVLLEGLVISYIDDYDEFVKRILKYVLKIDNWAICDTVNSSLKIIEKNKDKFVNLIDTLIKDKREFNKRFGFVILLDYYVEEQYLDLVFNYIKSVNSEDYYVNMAIAWLLCECYVKFTNRTYSFIQTTDLNEFVIRKTVSKVNDSYRVSQEAKEKLRDLKNDKIKISK